MFNHYYCVETKWIEQWLAYVFKNDKGDMPHPGPMTNRELAKKLLASTDQDRNRPEFYIISKPLFYMIQALYGGGPAIIDNKIFERV